MLYHIKSYALNKETASKNLEHQNYVLSRVIN